MSDDDDLFGGEGRPTDDQINRVAAYLRRHNREWGPRNTHRELLARGFKVSVPTVCRVMKKSGKTTVASKDVKAAEASIRVSNRRAKKTKTPKTLPVDPKKYEVEPSLVSKMAELLIEANSSTQLAIRENRARMALNIIIAEAMAAKPELLLLDMRGSAALVDALTCGAKLSGGASIDITIGGAKDDPAEGQMKDVTPAPKTALAADLAEFRRQRRANGHANGNGKGT